MRISGILLCSALFAPLSVTAATRTADVEPSLRHAVDQTLYKWNASGGAYRADNPAQRMSVEFRGGEAHLEHAKGSAAFRLTGYGYGDRLDTPSPAQSRVAGDRLIFQRGTLQEWYVNQSAGIEQGFTLTQRPEGPRSNKPLVITLQVTGGLRPRLEGGAVVLDSDKGPVLRYAGLRAWDKRGRAAPARMEAHEREIRLIVDDSAAQYPLTVDPSWTQQAELTASDGAAGDDFGYSVALSGTIAVVGAPYGAVSNQGKAYIFVQNGSNWTQQAEITAADGASIDKFGFSVAISGTTVVVGAPYHANYTGAAYVFVQNGSNWTQQAELLASDGVSEDQFGYTVAVSGTTALAGAITRTVGVNANQGAAYVFVQSGSNWTQQAELTASDGSAGDFFSWSVAVSGTTAMIGATEHGFQGTAYVFVQNGSNWTQQAELTASDAATGEFFGYSIALNGTTAVIGAPGYPGGSLESGAVYVFVRSGSNWTQQAELIASDEGLYDVFGYSVALSGTTAVIGAPVHSVGTNTFQGAAYVFVQNGSSWTQQDEFTSQDGASSDGFGLSVALSGTTALAGASAHNSNQGAVYTFVSSAAPPVVTSISPPSGPAAGGTAVTITGAEFTGATAVTIGGAACAPFTVNNDNSIGCTAPAGSAGTASVLVTTPNGTNAANTLFTYIGSGGPPPISSLSVSPGLVSFTYTQGAATSLHSELLSVTGPGGASWTVAGQAGWLSLSATSGGIPGYVTATLNAAGLKPGSYYANLSFSSPGSSAGVAGTAIPVALTVLPEPALTVSPAAIAFIGGSTLITTQLQVTTPGVTFSVAQGSPAQSWLQIGTTSGTGPAGIPITLDPTKLGPGTWQTSLVITSPNAANSPLAVPVTLVVSGGLVAQAPFLNNASFGQSAANAVAPNEELALFLPNFSCPAEPQVTINGAAAQVLAAVAGQIDLVTPAAVTAGPMAVSCAGTVIWNFNGVNVTPVMPGLFTLSGAGSGQGAVVNQDNTPNGAKNPASRDDTVLVYGTGFGAYNAVSADGLTRLAGRVTATIGGVPATVVYAGEAPGFTPGLSQINVTIPGSVTPGVSLPIVITIDGVSTQAGVSMAVQ